MWTDVIPGILVAAGMLLAPGTLLLACFRLHPISALVAAPPVSLALIAISTLAASAAGSAWDVRWVLGCTLICALLCGLWSWATPWGRRTIPHSFLSPAAAGQYLLGQIVAVAFMAPLFLRTFVEPGTIAQRYDNAFHLNAIEAIARTGEATAMDTGGLLQGSIYPNAWHTAAALVQELSGLGLAQSVHALALTTVLGVWPLSMWLLIEVLVRPSAVTRLLVGPLLLAFPGFPLVLLDWGLVYPTILGLAVAPALAAVLVHMIRDRTLRDTPVRTTLLIAAVGIGVGIAHPGAALAALLIVLPLAAVALISHVAGAVAHPAAESAQPVPASAHPTPGPAHPAPASAPLAPEPTGVDASPTERGGSLTPARRNDLLWAAVLAALVVAIVVIWLTMTPTTETAPWTRLQTPPQAVGEVVMGSVMGRTAIPVISLLTATGVVASLAGWTRDRRALLAMLGPAAVYFGSAALEEGAVRNMLSGFLYRDSFRTGAALTLGTVPVAAAGVDLLVRRAAGILDRVTRDRAFRRRRPQAVGAVVVAVVGLGASTALSWHVSTHPEVERQFDDASAAYLTWETSDLVSADEFEMFEALPQHVPEDGYVIADPWEGGGLTYALGKRDVNQLYMLLPRSPEEQHFDQNFSRIGQQPELCEVLPDDRPLYYLDLDEHRLGGNQVEWEGYEGYQGVTDATPGFDLVHEVGDVQLYEVTAC